MPATIRPSLGFLAIAIALCASSAHAQDGDAAGESSAPAGPPACLALDPGASTDFFGRALRDTPALAGADARRLNAWLAHGECMDAAAPEIANRVGGNPDDFESAFLEARLDALAGRRIVAERKLDALLQAHPDLQPAQLLKASLLLDREQREEARAWLGKAAAAQPEDLRVAFVQLRLEALDAPKGEGARKLMRVLRDKDMPPDLREQAQATLLYLTALDIDRKEAAMREGLKFASQTPRWNKSIALGRLLAEEGARPADARKALQVVLDDEAAPLDAKHEASVLVAETWLMEAAKIDPAPSERNAAQVEKARAAVEGDMVPVAGRIRRFHDLSALLPFVADVEDPEARGRDGLTLLCRGAQLFDESKVRRALEAGAAVDGDCAGSTALAYVVRSGTGLWNLRTGIVSALLAAGADPDPKLYPGSTYTAMSFCETGLDGCKDTLLPLLKEAAATRAARKP